MTRFHAAASALALCVATNASAAETPSKADILATYANIAQAKYDDSLIAAKMLQTAVHALIANPSDATLAAAKSASA